MALYQVSAGDRILAADINQYYNIIKGVTASGESITLIYNNTGVLILQPSSNPAAGTELIQIKNAAGTVQSALSSDGRFYAADGLVGTPGFAFESDKDNGLFRNTTNDISLVTAGVDRLNINAAGEIGLGTVGEASIKLAINGTLKLNVGNSLVLQNASANANASLVNTGATGASTLRLTANIININYAAVALGGGSAPTLGTIGGSGPAVAGQNAWLKVQIAGTDSYIPFWR